MFSSELIQNEKYTYAYELLGVCNFFIYEGFYTLYIVFCLCYSYDLHLTIKNPLYAPAKRMKLYYIAGTSFVLIFFAIECAAYNKRLFDLK